MKDDIHNTVLVDNSKDRAVLLSLGDIQKALSETKKGVKVNIYQFLNHWSTYIRYSQGNILIKNGYFDYLCLYERKRDHDIKSTWSLHYPTKYTNHNNIEININFSLWLTLFQHEPLQRDPANTLSKFTFCLPTCRISESTEKLMNLAYETLIEATQSTPQWYVCQVAIILP